jgi:hypothetical protein
LRTGTDWLLATVVVLLSLPVRSLLRLLLAVVWRLRLLMAAGDVLLAVLSDSLLARLAFTVRVLSVLTLAAWLDVSWLASACSIWKRFWLCREGVLTTAGWLLPLACSCCVVLSLRVDAVLLLTSSVAWLVLAARLLRLCCSRLAVVLALLLCRREMLFMAQLLMNGLTL